MTVETAPLSPISYSDLTTSQDSIDDISFKILSLCDEYQNISQTLFNKFKKGFFDLTLARNVIGQHRISSLQFDQRMQSSVSVDFNTAESSYFLSTDVSSNISASEIRNRGHMNSVENDGGFQGDPLKWYGVLVPTSLRTCQLQFKQAIPLIVNLSNIKLELRGLIEEYNRMVELPIVEKNNDEMIELPVQ